MFPLILSVRYRDSSSPPVIICIKDCSKKNAGSIPNESTFGVYKGHPRLGDAHIMKVAARQRNPSSLPQKGRNRAYKDLSGSWSSWGLGFRVFVGFRVYGLGFRV